jgi:putative transposase
MSGEPHSPRPPLHRHLTRLSEVWIKSPVYFLTTTTHERAPVLANAEVHAILVAEWQAWRTRHQWLVGPYVIMPDHVHFFASPLPAARRSLSQVMGAWKEWTAKRIHAEKRGNENAVPGRTRLWQPEFFDHVLRSAESRSEKWDYMRANPVRAGLVSSPEAWPYAGHIDFQ